MKKKDDSAVQWLAGLIISGDATIEQVLIFNEYMRATNALFQMKVEESMYKQLYSMPTTPTKRRENPLRKCMVTIPARPLSKTPSKVVSQSFILHITDKTAAEIKKHCDLPIKAISGKHHNIVMDGVL